MSKAKLFVLQGMKFGLVGISNTLIAFICFNSLVYFQVPYLFANFIGYGIGMINSYYWNYRFVFKQKTSIKTIVKFILGNLIVFIFSSSLLYLFIDVAGLHTQIAYIMSLSITMVINFLLSKFLIFN